MSFREITDDSERFVNSHGGDIVNNIVLINSKVLNKDYYMSKFRYFATGEGENAYAFVVEQNTVTFPFVTVRSPLKGINPDLLKEALTRIIDEIKPFLEKHGRILVCLEGKSNISLIDAVGHEGYGFDQLKNAVHMFFSSDKQILRLSENVSPCPEGFIISDVVVEADAETIHTHWPQAFQATIQATKDRLCLLPCVCARDIATGKIVSWMLSSPFGQMSNQYTLPEYRCRGLARAVEQEMCRKMMRLGLRPFKYVDDFNTAVIESSLRNYTRWEKNGKPVELYLTMVERRNTQILK